MIYNLYIIILFIPVGLINFKTLAIVIFLEYLGVPLRELNGAIRRYTE